MSTSGSISRGEYNRQVQIRKGRVDATKSDWERFRNGPASQNKLTVLLAYFDALRAEYNYRRNFWNGQQWGPQDAGHTRRIEVLEEAIIALGQQEALLDRQVHNEIPNPVHNEIPNPTHHISPHTEFRRQMRNPRGIQL